MTWLRSPFLKTDWTRACCQNLGTWLVCCDLVKRRESAGAISSATISRRRQGMLSGLDAFRGFSFFRSFKTPMLLTWISGIDWYGLGSGSGKFLMSSVVKTEQKCSFRMFALVLLSIL